jgi:hypothetical protein
MLKCLTVQECDVTLLTGRGNYCILRPTCHKMPYRREKINIALLFKQLHAKTRGSSYKHYLRRRTLCFP